VPKGNAEKEVTTLEADKRIEELTAEKSVGTALQYQLGKSYDLKCESATTGKVTITLEINCYSENDFDYILSELAMVSRKFYLDAANDIKSKL